MIYEIKNYENEEGKNVIEKTMVSKSDVLVPPTYTGVAGIPTPMGVKPFRFDFPQGYTLEQCFLEFEDMANAKFDEMREKAQEANRIITPSAVPNKGIIVP